MRLHRDVAESDPKSAAELLSLITELLDRPAPAASGTAEYALTEGNKLRDKKDYTGAIQWYKKAIALDPTSDVAQLNLGYCYYFLEQYQAALAPLQQAVKLDAKDADNQFWLGVTYYRLKQYAQALTTLREAIRLQPTSEASHYNLGETYLYGFKEYGKAASEYSEAIRLDPKYDLAYNQRGIAYLWNGQYAPALADFQAAYRMKSSSAQYLQNIGIAYFRLGKKDEATEIYDQLQPRHAKLADELFGLIAGTGPAKTKTESTKPAGSDANSLLLQAKEALDAAVDDDDFKEVIELSKKALAAKPGSTYAYEYLSIAYHEIRDYQHAVEAFAKYVGPTTRDFSILILYADSYSGLEKYDKAVPLYRQALKLAVKQTEKTTALWGIANGLYEANDFANALDPLRQFLLLAPANADALYYLGMCYMRMGKKAEAQQAQKKLEPLNRISAGNLQSWIDGMK